jgi:hypothetical protein
MEQLEGTSSCYEIRKSTCPGIPKRLDSHHKNSCKIFKHESTIENLEKPIEIGTTLIFFILVYIMSNLWKTLYHYIYFMY